MFAFFPSLKILCSFIVVCFCETRAHKYSLFLGCKHAILAHTLGTRENLFAMKAILSLVSM